MAHDPKSDRVIRKRITKGFFYMFRTPDHPNVVTFGVTRDPEIRFLYYGLADMEVLGIWAFKSFDLAEQFERTIKVEMQAGRIESFVIASPGRWSESVPTKVAIGIVERLQTMNGVSRVTWQDMGPWRDVTPESYRLRNNKEWRP